MAIDYQSEYIRLSTLIHDYESNHELSIVHENRWQKGEYAYQNKQYETAYLRVKSICVDLNLL